MDRHRPGPHPISRREFLRGAAGVSLTALLAACTGQAPGSRVPSRSAGPGTAAGSSGAAAGSALPTDLPAEVLLRLWRGYHPERSGRMILVPRGFAYMDGGISHSVPWRYMQHVPMFWYGPGIVRAQGALRRPVTSADVAPTLSRLVGFGGFEAPEGEPMEEVLEPGSRAPSLVVVLVWDAGGRYVLDLHPDEWPNLRAMIPHGTWYEEAFVGSSPSTTAPVHATLGTGAFPRLHGVMDNFVRRPDGEVRDPLSAGIDGLLLPTFADVYSEALDHRPVIGTVATLAWHLGMMGHGSRYSPSARHVAVLRQSTEDTGLEGKDWGLPGVHAPYFVSPGYVRDLPPLEAYAGFSDAADGTVDGLWRGHRFEDLRGGFDTPARIPYQARLIEEVVKREGFGQDDVPDLLFLNFKLIDEIGHLFTASSVEMADAIRVQDAHLPGFVRFLDEVAGRGRWAMLVTADHGHTASPEVSGGFPIKIKVLQQLLEDTWSRGSGPVAERIRPSWVFENPDTIEVDGLFLEEISSWLAGLTRGETAPDAAGLSGEERGERAFAAAFPGTLFTDRPPAF